MKYPNKNALNISITFCSDLTASINSVLRHTVLLYVKLSNRISRMFELMCKSEILSVRLNVWSALVDQTVIFISGYPSRSANGFLTAVIFSCAFTSLSFTDSEHESFWIVFLLKLENGDSNLDLTSSSYLYVKHITPHLNQNSNFSKARREQSTRAVALSTGSQSYLIIFKSAFQNISCSNTSVQHKLLYYWWTNSGWNHEFKKFNSSFFPHFLTN